MAQELDRAEFVRLAQALRAAGIRATGTAGDTAILVRSPDAARARAVIDALSPESDR